MQSVPLQFDRRMRLDVVILAFAEGDFTQTGYRFPSLQVSGAPVANHPPWAAPSRAPLGRASTGTIGSAKPAPRTGGAARPHAPAAPSVRYREHFPPYGLIGEAGRDDA